MFFFLKESVQFKSIDKKGKNTLIIVIDDNNYEKITSKLVNSREIIDLKEFQFEYSDIVDSISGLKTSLTPLTNSRNSDNDNCGNEIDSDTTGSALDGADIIIEDDDGSIFFNEYLDRWSEAVVSHDNIEREILKVAKFDACIENIHEKVKVRYDIDTLLNRNESIKELSNFYDENEVFIFSRTSLSISLSFSRDLSRNK